MRTLKIDKEANLSFIAELQKIFGANFSLGLTADEGKNAILDGCSTVDSKLDYDGIGWYSMVFDSIRWYCMVLDGIMLLNSIHWYSMVLYGLRWYCRLLHGI